MKGKRRKSCIRLALMLLFVSLTFAVLLYGLSREMKADTGSRPRDAKTGGKGPGPLDYQPGVSVCEQAQTKNLVPNSSFEQGIGWRVGWHETGDCDFDVVATPVHSGLVSARIFAGDTRDDSCRLFSAIQETPVEPGRFYDYSAWVKAELVRGRAFLRTRFLTQEGDPPVWISRRIADTDYVSDTQGRWVQVTGSVQAPPDARYARVDAFLSGSGKGFVWFDDVSLRLSNCLTVTKNYTPALPIPGQPLTYTIAYSNTGRENATDVWIVEDYDEYVDFVSADPPPAVTDRLWRIPELPAAYSGAITVVVDVAEDVGNRNWLFNDVYVWSDETVISASTCITTLIDNNGCDIWIKLIGGKKSKPGQRGKKTDYYMSIRNTGRCDGQANLTIDSFPGWGISTDPAPPYALTSGDSIGVALGLTVPHDAISGTYGSLVSATLDCDLPCRESGIATSTVTTTVAARGVFSGLLPLVMKNWSRYFVGPWEQEPNSACEDANGPLGPGSDFYYWGYLNDAWDYFYIDLEFDGRIIVDLDIETREGLQLQLLDEGCGEGCPELPYDCEWPYHIEYPDAVAGRYNVAVYRVPPYNSEIPYTLQVYYP